MPALMASDRIGAIRSVRDTTAAAVLSVVAVLALGASAASAETLPATCANVQAQLNAAAAKSPNHGEGDVVQLTGLCEAASLKSKLGVTIPKESNFTLEGAPGTTSGFAGEGVEHTLLHTPEGEPAGTIAIVNLTFERASISDASGGALKIYAHGLTLSGDAFLENTVHTGEGAAASIVVSPASCASSVQPVLTIARSTFRANSVVNTGENGFGGAVSVFLGCTLVPSVVEHDSFEANSLQAGGSNASAGGGLALIGSADEAAIPVVQADNVFDSNQILVGGEPGEYGGGGEWAQGIDLTSVGDRFSRNSLPGTSGASWSWGGGIGILNDSCSEKTPTQSTLEDAVITGNSIGAGEAKDLGGAGIYIGCDQSTTAPNHLALLDSTVTENSVPSGGVAGIDGHPEDHLAIENSIVANDSGGAEIGGFNGPGGVLTATYSDVCAAGSSAPLAGAGNICANPLLADNGNPSSFDVHETAASPTIDAGSNALVPSGLTSDFYGNPRIVSSTTKGSCGDGSFPGPAVVDIGADEAPAGTRVIMPPCLSIRQPPHPSTFALPSFGQRPSGLVALTFAGLARGEMTVLGTFKVSRTVVSIVKGHHKRRHKLETVVYGRASYTVSTPGNVKIQLKPTKHALALLKKRKHLQVLLTITFTGVGDSPTTHEKTITVTYVKPRPKHHG
jgi:hypothetical protein